jgi:hypothetical protein
MMSFKNHTNLALLMIAFLLVGSVNICYAQSITYEETKDPAFIRKSKGYELYEMYTAKDGSVFRIGSKLKSGEPFDGRSVSVLTGGHSNKVLTTSEYTNYFEAFKRYYDATPTMVEGKKIKATGRTEELTITRISAVKGRGSQAGTITIQVYATLDGTDHFRFIKDLETALDVGEVINPDRPMTRDEAIAKLKEAKDLMDLGLITEAEYNKLREELTPIIMGDKKQ